MIVDRLVRGTGTLPGGALAGAGVLGGLSQSSHSAAEALRESGDEEGVGGMLLNILSGPQRLAYKTANRVLGTDYSPETIARDLTGIDNPLLNMLGAAATDPLSYVGGFGGGAAGRQLGRRIGMVDELAGRGLAAAQGKHAYTRADELMTAARQSHIDELEKMRTSRTFTMGDYELPERELREALQNPESPLYQQLIRGGIEGWKVPVPGKKTMQAGEALEDLGYALPIGGERPGYAIYASGAPVRGRGRGVSVLSDQTVEPGPIARAFDPELNPMPEVPPPTLGGVLHAGMPKEQVQRLLAEMRGEELLTLPANQQLAGRGAIDAQRRQAEALKRMQEISLDDAQPVAQDFIEDYGQRLQAFDSEVAGRSRFDQRLLRLLHGI